MINQTVSSAPLRLSLFGGGTDIPFVFNQLGEGLTISAAIHLPVTVICSSLPFYNGIKLKYSSNETVSDIDNIIHPIK